ncbi:aldehyde dehydrogenase family protein [Sphingomonas rhizophila]|uniref:aldehyde dehydrogenase (NAD(+)) n=1 Tax=Sphingomonas rhizophila TaxID=2071607 RepID=A0A7G9SBZ8_9SPHN|nr:aldehyde dehydrogenase family protein [Sphingomonas rhizophila]QNN65373.1 aldehyde dehydrogenase family protein [Sphingomonas rhizophila]
MTGRIALLSIDLQRDYLARRGLMPEAETLVANAEALLGYARSKGWLVVHVRTESDADQVMPHRRDVPEVVAGSAGAESPPELTAVDGESVVIKRFFDPFDRPELDERLRESGVARVVLMGVQSHACIRAAAVSAYARGYDVAIATEAVGSDSPLDGDLALEWLDRRAMTSVRLASLGGVSPAPVMWRHVDPTDRTAILFEVESGSPASVAAAADTLRCRQPGLKELPTAERASRLRRWHDDLNARRPDWVEAIVRDVAKPRRDAEGEVAYGLDLLANVAATVALGDEAPHVARHPHGLVGLITPWNNPFALAVGKIAPALGFGNVALLKPAFPGARIATRLIESLEAAGLADFIAVAQGGPSVGRAVANVADAVSITGSTLAGQQLAGLGGHRRIPVQAEMGGNNAAIVDESADLDAAAVDLAAAMFSFSGQRCTAVRRVILLDSIAEAFTERLAAATRALPIGMPSDPATIIGPVISEAKRDQLLTTIASVGTSGGRLLCGGEDGGLEGGSWLAPTIVDHIDPAHPLVCDEQFGPVVALESVTTFDDALAAHDRTGAGLLGALFSTDEARIARFRRVAMAGILSINRARPPFDAGGPFVGWKDSGFGVAEHGRWNRDVYTRVQAVYR